MKPEPQARTSASLVLRASVVLEVLSNRSAQGARSKGTDIIA